MADSAKSMTVIVAVDRSTGAEQAFHWYLKNAHREDHKVILVHCVEQPITLAGDLETAGLVYSRMLNEASFDGAEVKKKFCTLLGLREIPARYISAVHPKPGQWIVDVANQEDAALIVTGSRGLNTMRRTMLGSVSTHVLHHAKCPVAVCNSKKK